MSDRCPTATTLVARDGRYRMPKGRHHGAERPYLRGLLGLPYEILAALRAQAGVYGLHSVLRLHFTQEEENYFSLAP